MAPNASPADLSLSEFLTKLVTDASEACMAAQQYQESYYSDLQAASTSKPEDFAKSIPESEVDRELANLFPSPDPTHASQIFVGAAYRPSQPGIAEDPPIHQILGVRLVVPRLSKPGVKSRATAGAPAPQANPVHRLTREHVQFIRDAVHLQVALRQQGYLQKVLAQPRVGLVMDKLRITAKVGMGAQTGAAGSVGTTAAPVPSAILTPLQKLLQGRPPLQLHVRMASDKAPDANSPSVDVYSEIELTLKSVAS